MLENVNIGIDDDFVELGGHSLLALKLEVELQRHFDIDHFDLQECNTIRKMAAYIEEKLAVAVGGGGIQ
ncbi:phosphopantetheine-binding protein [Paenibacillus woosongensis]|uniref:Phosphopantetheine-binding protein n=1 Tax=Paenibacillus woosongensis TaxID=307580 RepID=A0AA95L091_9BACL|nr:phosphopantetheine-binding protein [Paenibacillus woosongensis]WHX47904.1 phosphopantetheine-binding protein [Paenibacillus woosongensis]